jgi:multidrug efflux system outer membrane protein
LDLFSRRSTGGVSSRIQVLRAQANLAQVAATIPDLLRLTAIKENQICMLLGRVPGPIPRGQALTDQTMPVEVPSGLPSALLERRPDIRQAEQSLIAANAQIGVAIADYFPRIGLTAFFGKVSPELSAFSSGSSNAWSVAGSLSGPIFTAGRTKAQVDQAKALADQASLQYEQTVKNAFGEVANTLVTREHLGGIEAELQKQVEALTASVTYVPRSGSMSARPATSRSSMHNNSSSPPKPPSPALRPITTSPSSSSTASSVAAGILSPPSGRKPSPETHGWQVRCRGFAL